MFNLMKEYHKKFNSLNKLKPQKENNKKRKQEVLTNVGDIYNELYDIYKSKYNKKINSLDAKNKKKLDYKKLRLSDNYLYLSEEEQEEQKEIFPIKSDDKTKQQTSKKPTKDDLIALNKRIIDEEIDLNEELFNKYFKIQRPSDMVMYLNKTNDTEKNNEVANLIKSGLKDLKEEIKKMSKEEKEIEDAESIVEIVEQILKFNKQNQQGKGLKILTANQMLSRLSITLAQLKEGYNSEKLKNEIRKLLHSLYRSKSMTKQVYNNLIKYI